MLAILGDTSDGYGLVIHPSKIECMVLQPTMDDSTITFRLIPISHVTPFKYLGMSINHTRDDSKEVRMRIGPGKSTLQQYKYLCFTCVSLEIKAQLAQARIMSRVLYRATTLPLKATDIR